MGVALRPFSRREMSHPGLGTHHISGLASAVARYCPLWALTTPSRFCFWELTRELPSGSPIMDCTCANSLNFRVPMEPEASELPKSLVLGKDENIHIKLT
ncbi:hypothetical protein C1H46_038573 [Malus baccata]|uniref:Uncharacterized protein n=1 Tax=Malus baccata TaxID=106549 RepID=A0A540KPF7_MALBA|nr:hypothetical protein C1H46_038573 [Malus baccata]